MTIFELQRRLLEVERKAANDVRNTGDMKARRLLKCAEAFYRSPEDGDLRKSLVEAIDLYKSARPE